MLRETIKSTTFFGTQSSLLSTLFDKDYTRISHIYIAYIVSLIKSVVVFTYLQ